MGKDGLWRVATPRVAQQYRMNVGTIVELPLLKVKLRRGPVLGEVEESFIQGLVPGDTFTFDGLLQVQPSAQNRYDIGFYIGADPLASTNADCAVAVIPPEISNIDNDGCGDTVGCNTPPCHRVARRGVRTALASADVWQVWQFWKVMATEAWCMANVVPSTTSASAASRSSGRNCDRTRPRSG